MSYSTELRTKLTESIEQLESELVALRSAVDALDASERSTTPAAEQRAKRRRGRRTRGAEIVPAGKIESLLGRTDGITTAELARQTNGGHEQILSILKELEQAGKAYRSGTRRSTRWHAGAGSNGGAPESQPVAAAA